MQWSHNISDFIRWVDKKWISQTFLFSLSTCLKSTKHNLELQTMTSFYAGGLSQWKFAVRGTPKFFHQIQNLTITS